MGDVLVITISMIRRFLRVDLRLFHVFQTPYIGKFILNAKLKKR
jgi:hypothetical protein